MKFQFLIFILVMTLVLSLATVYVVLNVLRRSAWAGSHKEIIWGVAIVFLVIQVLGPLLYRSLPAGNDLGFVFLWVTYTTLGLLSVAFVYTVFSDVMVLLTRPWVDSTVDLERRSLFGVVGLSALTGLVGGYQALKGPTVEHVEVPIENLPSAFEGFRIVQISDLHVGPTIGPRYSKNVVEMANRLNGDMVALTGDLFDGTLDQLRDGIAPLKELKSTFGSFFVTGNHEYYWGVEEWLEEIGSFSKILHNEHIVIEKEGDQLVLGGVPDPTVQRIQGQDFDVKKAFENAPVGAPRILLAHQPKMYVEAEINKVDLQLSGHTHGGQYFPWNIVVGMIHRYYKGLNRHNKMWVYVNKGTGYWGPPMRFGVPSEITLIQLVKAKGEAHEHS